MVKYLDPNADTICANCTQSSTAGGALKSTTGWNSPNTGATNSSGFTALPGGYRDGDGGFDAVGYYGFWWSSSDEGFGYAWFRSLYYDDAGVARPYSGYLGAYRDGLSIRCVRDSSGGSTSAVIPSVTTASAGSITANSAIAGGNVTSDGGAAVTVRGVAYGTSANPTTSGTSTSDGIGTGAFTSQLSGLVPYTQYFVRAYATNLVGTAYGNELSFNTIGEAPMVTTLPVTTITDTSASSGGVVTSDGGEPVTARGLVISTDGVLGDVNMVDNRSCGGGFMYDLSTGGRGVQITAFELLPVNYGFQTVEVYYKLGSKNGYQTSSSSWIHEGSYNIDVQSSTITLPIQGISIPPNSTFGIYLSYYNYYDGQGGDFSDSVLQISNGEGLCSPWQTCCSPRYWRGKIHYALDRMVTNDGFGLGVFNRTITGLSPATTYSLRAYATNSVGTSFGGSFQFTTLSMPVVVTGHISGIHAQGASYYGEVVSSGSGSVLSRGLVYGTSPMPTTQGLFTTDGAGTGIFNGVLSGLTPSTLYFTRAYATNAVGTAYGNEVQFYTSAQPQPCSSAPTATDIDGNIYNTVQIGSQCWLTGNLKVSRYRNGDNINEITDNNSWSQANTGAWSYFLNDSTNNATFAKLYNWFAVGDSRGICPTGWHVPTTSEFDRLISSAGGSSNANLVLKSRSGWYNNTNGSDSLGFNATPAGWRSTTGDFNCQTACAEYWMNSQASHTNSYFAQIYYLGSDVSLWSMDKRYGFSVRCIQDCPVGASNLPTVNTAVVSQITINSAICGGDVVSDGGCDLQERGVVFSEIPSPSLSRGDNWYWYGGVVGAYSINLANLNHSTTYYIRAYATNSVGTAYGNEVSFTTLSIVLPTINTLAAVGISHNSAQVGGEILYDGGAIVQNRGIAYGTSPGPDLSNFFTNEGSGTGIFYSYLSGLIDNTTYYARAYATNSVGTAYGNEVSFTTLSIVLPTINTLAAVGISHNSAQVGGEILYDGGAIVQNRGIAYGTSPGPDLSNFFTNEGSGTGIFYSTLSGLNVATTYYSRAYATNSLGTAYGNQVTFTTNIDVTIGTGTGTNSSTGYPAPYGTWYWGARHQFLIRASELAAQGVSSTAIRSLAFNVASAQAQPLNDFTIKLGHTSEMDLNSGWLTGLTVVYSQTYVATTGWNTHSFSTPFVWNGTDNIVIEVCFQNSYYTYNSLTYNSNTGFVASRVYRADSYGVCDNPNSYDAFFVRPNMQLGVNRANYINGQVTYLNRFATPVNQSIVELRSGNSVSATITTDAQGQFSFIGVPNGQPFHFGVATQKPWGGVNATDAFFVNQHFSGRMPLTGLFHTAADVNLSNVLNATDALQILSRYAVQGYAFAQSDWVFSDTTITLQNDSATVHLRALTAGDANGSYVPLPGLRQSAGVWLGQGGLFRGEGNEWPVHAGENMEVAAISLELSLPEGMWVRGIRVPQAPEGSSPVVFHQTDRVLRLAWFGTQSISLRSGEELLVIEAEDPLSSLALPAQWVALGECELADGTGTPLSMPKLWVPTLSEHAAVNWDVRCIPNPMSNESYLSIQLPQPGSVRFQISDATGRLIHQGVTGQYAEGVHRIDLPVSDIPPGVYHCSVFYQSAAEADRRQLRLVKGRN